MDSVSRTPPTLGLRLLSAMASRSPSRGHRGEPPFTWEEEQELYRRMSPKPGVPMTIYRGPKKAADKPAQSEPPQPEGK
jgi:hypothetical protein